jgi:ribosomal protein L7/L12
VASVSGRLTKETGLTLSDEGGGFDVLLTDAGEKKIPVIKVARAVTGMGLKEAKALVDQAPSTLTRGLDGSQADALKSELEGLGAVVELHPSSVGAVVHEAVPARVVAKFAPGLRSIKLYEEGRIEYQGRTESIVGATARVDSSGSKRVFRDTREVFLMIEGPRVSIAAPLTNKGHTTQTSARKFAAEVNKLAMRLGEANAAQASAATPTPSQESDVLDRLERLGKLRDSGVLTEEEFQAQKSALLSD